MFLTSELFPIATGYGLQKISRIVMEPETIPVEPETIPETPVVKVKKTRSPAQLEVLFRARLKAAESIQKRVATKKASIVAEVVPDVVPEKVIEKIPEPKINDVPIVSKPPDDVVRAIVVPVPKKFKFSAEHGGYVLI